MPTGATVAALTTSLPETPGGERNWDYRYTWMRDSTFTLQALHWLNLDWEADEFMQFIADLEPNADGSLQIMYGIDGRRDLTESTRDDLSGYAGARAGADRQRRLRPAPERRLRRRAGLDPAAHPAQPAAAAAAVADRGDAGGVRDARLARARPGHLGGARRAAALRVVEAHVLGRDGPRRQARRDPRRRGSRQRWRDVADEIKADILEHGVDGRGVLRQHYATDALDASTLLAAIFGFLPRRRAAARERAGDRRRADRGRLRPALPHRRDRRRAVRARRARSSSARSGSCRRWRSSASCSGRAT